MSRPIATVGGAISTNGIGYTAAKYGSMGEQVLGMEVVLTDGEVIRTREVPKPSYGPSLDHLFIGSEGTLGVIVEATLRAFPRPEKRQLRCMVFPDFESGVAEASLYLAFEGFKEVVDAQDAKTMEICRSLGGRDGEQSEVQRFWETRHASGERYRRDVLQTGLEESDQGQDTFESMAETVDSVLALAQEMGGTMEYCHGVGVKLAHLMEDELGAGISVVRRLKKTLDPNNILNPGKILG